MALSSTTQRTIAASFAGLLLLAGAAGLISLLQQEPVPLVERVRQAGTLVVATRRSPATYFNGATGPDGIEYALVNAFARHLGVQVRQLDRGDAQEGRGRTDDRRLVGAGFAGARYQLTRIREGRSC